MQKTSTPQSFTFFLVPGFSMVALSCAIDALRAANIESHHANFSWTLVAESTGLVQSSSGIDLPCTRLEELYSIDVVAICGGEQSHNFKSAKVDRWLKTLARRQVMIGSISDGAYILAASGLFDNCRSTIHWKCQSGYRERYPELDIRTSILEVDGKRFSCAGGTSSLDLMLHFITKATGPDTADRVADNFFHDIIRGEDQLQPLAAGIRYAARDENLTRALTLMASNMEHPLRIGMIADTVGLSHRQLDRLSRKHLGMSPGDYYRNLRLTRAAGLLRQTGLTINEVALGCGFQSSSHLSAFFKNRYNTTPLQFRLSE